MNKIERSFSIRSVQMMAMEYRRRVDKECNEMEDDGNRQFGKKAKGRRKREGEEKRGEEGSGRQRWWSRWGRMSAKTLKGGVSVECRVLMDESVLALVSQLHPDGAVCQPTAVETDSPLKVLPVLTESEPNALGKSLFVLEDAHQEEIDIVVLEEPPKSIFVHLIGHSSYEYLKVILVLHGVLLFLPQLSVLFAISVLQSRQYRAFLKLNALKFGAVFSQLLSDYLCQVFKFFGDVEDYTLLVLVLLHALD